MESQAKINPACGGPRDERKGEEAVWTQEQAAILLLQAGIRPNIVTDGLVHFVDPAAPS
jgi:hypothetical protein